MHYGGRLTRVPGPRYVGGKIDFVVLINIYKFSIHEIDGVMDNLGYNGTEHIYYRFLHPLKDLDNGIEDLCSDQDILNLSDVRLSVCILNMGLKT